MRCRVAEELTEKGEISNEKRCRASFHAGREGSVRAFGLEVAGSRLDRLSTWPATGEGGAGVAEECGRGGVRV